jgi:DNA-binding NarL/FixJ family response regulator
VHAGNDHVALTKRQKEILCHLARGSSNAGIAADLGISPKTVQRHIADIFPTLGVHNRTAAANWAIRNGLA